MTHSATWFDDVPVVSALPPRQAAALLRQVGENDIALELEQSRRLHTQPRGASGIFDMLRSAPRAWMHSAHTFGFVPGDAAESEPTAIVPAGRVNADVDLKGARLTIALNRLRVADYPGSGPHRILLHFFAQNQISGSVEDLHFSTTLRVEEGSQAGVVGYAVVVGLNVGNQGVAFKCFTVNLKNDGNEALLSLLESDIFKSGLKLATVAQPALLLLPTLAIGLTKTIAKRNRNVPVQDFYLGLDFAASRLGARLALGDYVAVQVPAQLRTVWNWGDWAYFPDSGEILNRADGSYIPFNYVVFGVSRYEGE